MFKITFVAGVLFTATLVTGGTADAHLAHHHHGPVASPGIRVAARHGRHGAARAHVAARRGSGGGSGGVGAPPSGTQTGRASYYGGGHATANGGRVGVATCAHRTLPFGTRVLVTNLANARAAVLTVNDRGPFVRGRIVDVSTAAAQLLGMLHAGVASVRVRVIGPG